jgi:probable phosphoglycerate mutase
VIVFVRHGQTAPNREGLLLGRSDPPLTDEGRRQADRLAARLGALVPALVVTSPLARALETADAIVEVCAAPLEVDDRLVEVDYGAWEARPFAELPRDVVARWRDDADFAPPGGESLGSVGRRIAGFCEERLGEEVIVAVSHVSPIKAAVTWALGVGDELAWRMRLDVASVTRIGAGPVLLSFNEPLS